MLTNAERENLVVDVQRSCYESLDLEDLGEQVLPSIERLLDVSASVLYRCENRHQMMPFAGTHSKLANKYQAEYYRQDPLQGALARMNPWIQHVPRLPEWQQYLKLPVYLEFTHPIDIDHMLHLRLTDSGYHEPGMIGLMLARTIRQDDFCEADILGMARVLPALEALVRRSARLKSRLEQGRRFETMLGANGRSLLAMDLRGRLLWVSEKAEQILKGKGRKSIRVPDELSNAARRLAELRQSRSNEKNPPGSITIARGADPKLRVELSFQCTAGGDPFIVAELLVADVGPVLAEVAARYGLTASETEVLRLISHGLSEIEIAGRLFVSKATVHSHAIRVLAKLGVHSRVQAALIARGLSPENEAAD